MNPFDETRKKLDRVSCSFCLAKWKQVTIHLQNGQTHSCHHPATHSIPLEELKKDPSALHNTRYKKLQRKLMLEDVRPPECDYCWNIEDLPGTNISDRVMKSSDDWAAPYFDEVRGLDWRANVNPSYVEVSFSNKCNFKCTYCAPHISSSWEKEVIEHGPYKLSIPYNDLEFLKTTGQYPLIEEEKNPYVEAFWNWLPSLYPDLMYLRVTGGEPLLSPNTFRLLEFVEMNANSKLSLAVNSNLGVPRNLVQSFSGRIAKIQSQKSCKSFSVYTSVDTWGDHAEYIRTGLKLNLFEENLKHLLTSNQNINLTVMCTFNALSVARFDELIQKIRSWKALAAANSNVVILDISYLRHPLFLSILTLPKSWKPKFENIVKLMEEKRGDATDFTTYEIEKSRRLCRYFIETTEKNPQIQQQRRDLASFIKEADQRRKTNFFDTFPEYAELIESWAG